MRDGIRLAVARLADAVPASSACAVLGRYGASYTLHTSGNKARFLIANRTGLSADEHTYAAPLLTDLLATGVRVIAYLVL